MPPPFLYIANVMGLPEWFKFKNYPHIGLPIVVTNARSAINYISNAKKIEHHQFRPLIRRNVLTYPHRRVAVNGSLRRKSKIRPLTFASHLDANIYAYYAYKLQEKYEDFITNNQLGDVVVAYRKIPCTEGGGNKCNIHIAHDVFSYIKLELANCREVAVITFDIKGFFDNLDHRIIKKTWKQTIESEDMPLDEYAVFRSVTHYSYINEQDIYSLFKDRILCRKANKIIARPVKHVRYLRKHRAVAYCQAEDIKEIKKHNLLEIHQENIGIPQGLPISAILANIYMRDFDVEVNNYVTSIGGIYKRYSDDIVIVCPIPRAITCKQFVMENIKKVNLEIEERKTNLFEIHICHGQPVCFHETKGTNKPLEYLGFAFDGRRVLLKNASLCRYYAKMQTGKRRHKFWAIGVNNSTSGRVFTNQIVRRFTLAGSKRYHKMVRGKKGLIRLKEKSYGNYLTYAFKSATIMGESAIRHQLRRNLNKVKQNIAEINYDVYRVLLAKFLANINQ